MKYKNITISGRVGAGSSTLLKQLKTYLEPLGWKFFSGGEFMRQYAIDKGLISAHDAGHHKATVYSDDFDRQVDYGMKERLQKEENLVLESDLSGFMAQGIPGVLKVLLVCDDALRIDRVANRDNVTILEAKEHVLGRAAENVEKWKRLYGDYDFWEPKNFDLVINTYSNSKIETVGKVLDALGYNKEDDTVTK
jgi:predicted cytidylate kinase